MYKSMIPWSATHLCTLNVLNVETKGILVKAYLPVAYL